MDYGSRFEACGFRDSVIPAEYGDSWRSDQPGSRRYRSGLCSVPNLELDQEIGDVGLNGACADEEGFGDLPIRFALGEKPEDIALASS
jgi:hypothetical protein